MYHHDFIYFIIILPFWWWSLKWFLCIRFSDQNCVYSYILILCYMFIVDFYSEGPRFEQYLDLGMRYLCVIWRPFLSWNLKSGNDNTRLHGSEPMMIWPSFASVIITGSNRIFLIGTAVLKVGAFTCTDTMGVNKTMTEDIYT